ncbi:MAG: nitronate monooxygenase [Candidatus Omnitrophica bacterium]|nr:nitronate monooxygenase [Candidatus Omnitrophota bacterium]
MPKLKIGKYESRYPVIQAGMGVRVGNAALTAAAIECGGMGVISSVGLGEDFHRSLKDYEIESEKNLSKEIRKARELTGGKGPLGVNIMVVLTNYESMIKTAVNEGIDFIISGAGLPLRLPEFAKDRVALVPVVSSARALELIVRTWQRKYKKAPDAAIIEGPLCGGHLAFTNEQLDNPKEYSLEILYRETKDVLDRYSLGGVPLIAAGAISVPEDVLKAIEWGYQGVQIGTRFICTEESGMSEEGKKLYVSSGSNDTVTISSPVGMPVRVIKSPLVERVLSGKKEPFACPYKCLRSCDKNKVLFCIARALLYAWKGNIDKGLFMTGYDLSRVNDIIPIKKFFDDLDKLARAESSSHQENRP